MALKTKIKKFVPGTVFKIKELDWLCLSVYEGHYMYSKFHLHGFWHSKVDRGTDTQTEP
jgi:hypothetical protein